MQRSKRRLMFTTHYPFVLFILLFTGIGSAHAQIPVGVRAGVSIDPDQFYFGAHVETRPLMENLRFRPNIEAGFGDNSTVVGFNGEFVYQVDLEEGYAAYFGAGPAINIISLDGRFHEDTRVEPGLNFLIGLEFPQDYFAELKVGAIDSPLFKFGIGYTFRP